MKKRILATLMTLTLGTAMLTACGSTAEDVNVSVETDVVDSTTEPAEETTVDDVTDEDVDSTDEADTEDVDSTDKADTEDVDSTDEADAEDDDSTDEADAEDVDSTDEADAEEATTEEAAN